MGEQMREGAGTLKIMTHYTAGPTEDRKRWMVWDMYESLPPKPIFLGTMIEAENVAEAKNRSVTKRLSSPASAESDQQTDRGQRR